MKAQSDLHDMTLNPRLGGRVGYGAPLGDD